jgi:hypothetical protein
MTTLTAAKAKKKTAAEQPLPGGYAGKILRVDMTKGKCWAEPWGAERMRQEVGGIGLGAMILYKETAKGKKNVTWDDPENRLVLATGPLAGTAGVGHGRAHGDHDRRRHQRPHLDAGERLLRHQPQVLRLRRDRGAGPVEDVEVPLHQR